MPSRSGEPARRGPARLGSLLLAAALVAGCRRAPPPAPPAAPQPTIRDSGGVGARALDRLKELTGNWVAGEVPASFEVVERGHAVLQRGGVFVVWHADGNTLAASVFAFEGYHARMRSTKIDEGPGGELTIELATYDSGNVTPDEPLARSLVMTIAPKNDGVTQRWSFGDNLDAPPRELVLVRTDTGALPPSTKLPPPPTPEAAPP